MGVEIQHALFLAANPTVQFVLCYYPVAAVDSF
jgi:hypothetical protein